MYNDIPSYVDYLVDKSNSRTLYNTYLISENLNIIVRDGFLWLLLIYNKKKNEPCFNDNINKVIQVAFYILVLAVIFRYLANNLQSKLILNLEKYHLENCVDILKNFNRKNLLNSDLTKYALRINVISESFKVYLERKFFNTKILTRFVTVYLSVSTLNVAAIIGLLIFFNVIIFFIQRKVIDEEFNLLESSNKLNNRIREQIVESKQKFINNNFNTEHLKKLYESSRSQTQRIWQIRNNIGFYSEISVLIITGILIFKFFKNIPVFEKILYLFVVDDLNGIFEGFINLYRTRPLLKLADDFVKQFCSMSNDKHIFDGDINGKVDKVLIDNFEIEEPNLKLKTQIELENNKCFLLNGHSGCGKSTFLKCLKGLYPCKLDYKIFMRDGSIHRKGLGSLCYFSLQSQKGTYAKYLYDYITNFNKNPNCDLINVCLKNSKIDHLFKGNDKIKLSKFSGGEQIRLSIAQMLYEILTSNYQIIMLDEMDANLDTKTAETIFKNIRSLFKDKIIFVILHNEDLKALFENVINVNNNLIQ
jgi:ABC-type lipoprotein export system ATPase subunit